jgi:hypothetical protein
MPSIPGISRSESCIRKEVKEDKTGKKSAINSSAYHGNKAIRATILRSRYQGRVYGSRGLSDNLLVSSLAALCGKGTLCWVTKSSCLVFINRMLTHKPLYRTTPPQLLLFSPLSLLSPVAFSLSSPCVARLLLER